MTIESQFSKSQKVKYPTFWKYLIFRLQLMSIIFWKGTIFQKVDLFPLWDERMGRQIHICARERKLTSAKEALRDYAQSPENQYSRTLLDCTIFDPICRYITSCISLEVYRYFGGICRPLLQVQRKRRTCFLFSYLAYSSTVSMKVTSSPESSAEF